MLLPSALPCSPRPTRTHFAPYGSLFSPPPTPTATTATSTTATSTQQNYASPILTTCRALQSLLGVSAPRNIAPPATSRFSQRAQDLPFEASLRFHQQAPQTPPRKQQPRPKPLSLAIHPCANRIHKRSYSSLASPSTDQDNLTSQPSTPKRQRCAPAIIPRGLSDADFEALEPVAKEVDAPSGIPAQRFCTRAKVTRRIARPCDLVTGASIPDLDSARGEAFVANIQAFAVPHSSTLEIAPTTISSSPSPDSTHHGNLPLLPISIKATITTTNMASADGSTSSPSSSFPPSSTTSSDWTSTDDIRLLALVLDKLRLSRRDWDECARAMAGSDDGASLGRRWDALVGDGRVGVCLRRGDRRKRGAVGKMFGGS